MSWQETKDIIKDAFEDLIFGVGSSVTWTLILPETIHMLAVVITTALSIIVAHYVKKWLKSKDDGNNS
jgi:hypothetical protein